MAMKTFHGGLYLGSIARAILVSSKIGKAVLSITIMKGDPRCDTPYRNGDSNKNNLEEQRCLLNHRNADDVLLNK